MTGRADCKSTALGEWSYTCMIRRFFKKLLTPPMIGIVALIMFFEEWGPTHGVHGMGGAAAAAVTGRGPSARGLYGPATVSAMKSHSPWRWRRESWVKSM